MSAPTMETLARRLDRENRRLKRTGALGLVVIAVVVLMGQVALSQAAAAEAPAGRATVKRDGVPVYAQMGNTSEVVETLKQGAVVTVDFALSGPNGAWCRITMTRREGYVRCEDLEREPASRWRETGRRTMAPPQGGPTKVPIRVVENITLVEARINGSESAMMVVDTGANGTIVTPALLERLLLSIPTNAPRRQGQVVGGEIIEMPVVSLASIQVGDAMIEDLPVGVYEAFPDAPHVDGVLGADFLHRFRVTLDKAAREMRLEALQP